MTQAQFEKLKQIQLQTHYSDTRRINEVFPDIASIKIQYHLYHTSFCDRREEEKSWSVNMQSQMNFYIDCLNPECSSYGFNLENEIYSMYRAKQTEKTGEMRCGGQEAPDHPEQSCDGRINYTIKIVYK